MAMNKDVNKVAIAHKNHFNAKELWVSTSPDVNSAIRTTRYSAAKDLKSVVPFTPSL